MVLFWLCMRAYLHRRYGYFLKHYKHFLYICDIDPLWMVCLISSYSNAIHYFVNQKYLSEIFSENEVLQILNLMKPTHKKIY